MARPLKQKPPFETEVALCAAFIAAIDKRVWTPYAETAGWDLLLSRKRDGFQIGVQAKLAFNLDVVNQAIEDHKHWTARDPGPDCRAVLVPDSAIGKLSAVCDYIGVVVIRMRPTVPRNVIRADFDPDLPNKPDAYEHWRDLWHEWAPMRRHELPDYVPDVAAGASAPLQLTDWKIKAIKLTVMLELNGQVTRADFHHLSLDHRRWIANGWLQLPAATIKNPRPGYVAGGMPNFKTQHPVVYEKIKKDAPKWLPKQLDLMANQN